MPRRTTTPADEGIQAAREERTAASEQTAEQAAAQEQTAQISGEPDAASNLETTPATALPMKIDARITSTRNYYNDPTRAFATVTLNDALVIKGFRVVKDENGLFCSMPARRLRNGEYSEICHPITQDFAQQLHASVLNEYQVHLAQQMEESLQTPHNVESENTPAQEPPAPEPGPEMEMM